jgi:hypothetical protein
VPAILGRRIGTGPHTAGPLHGKSPDVHPFAHRAGMIPHSKLLFDDPGNPGRCPEAGIQTVSDRTAVQNVSQLLLLRFAQFCGAAGTNPFPQTIDALALITWEPLAHLGPWRLQELCQLATGIAFRIQHHRASSFGDAVSSFPFGLLAQSGSSLIGAGMQAKQARQHRSV